MTTKSKANRLIIRWSSMIPTKNCLSIQSTEIFRSKSRTKRIQIEENSNLNKSKWIQNSKKRTHHRQVNVGRGQLHVDLVVDAILHVDGVVLADDRRLLLRHSSLGNSLGFGLTKIVSIVRIVTRWDWRREIYKWQAKVKAVQRTAGFLGNAANDWAVEYQRETASLNEKTKAKKVNFFVNGNDGTFFQIKETTARSSSFFCLRWLGRDSVDCVDGQTLLTQSQLNQQSTLG